MFWIPDCRATEGKNYYQAFSAPHRVCCANLYYLLLSVRLIQLQVHKCDGVIIPETEGRSEPLTVCSQEKEWLSPGAPDVKGIAHGCDSHQDTQMGCY